MRRLTRVRRDDGVTLIELMLAITIMVIIVGPLTAAIIVYLRHTDATVDRMAESHDAQISAAYFAQDVQNIGVRDWSRPPFTTTKQSIELNVAYNAGLYPCGISGSPAALVRFAWDDPAVGNPNVLRVSYAVTVVGTERQLHRISCNASGTVTSDIVLVHYVDPSSAPVLTCTTASGATTSCTSTTLPAAVNLALAIRAPGDATAYNITLIGQRRQT